MISYEIMSIVFLFLNSIDRDIFEASIKSMFSNKLKILFRNENEKTISRNKFGNYHHQVEMRY